MIAHTTKPGTDVICIDASDGSYGPSRLALNGLYTVKAIHPGLELGWCVELHEVPAGETYDIAHGMIKLGYALERFRYLDLPPALTDLLVCRELEDV